MEEALSEFGCALKKLKEVYAEEYNCNPNYVEVSIHNDYVILSDGMSTGGYVDCYREYIG